MDSCFSALSAFPTSRAAADALTDEEYDKKIRRHVDQVRELVARREGDLTAHATALLTNLDPSLHTFSYLFLLDLTLPKANVLEMTDPATTDKVAAFLAAFDPRQIRYLGAAFTRVFVAASSGRLMPASVAVPLLARALHRVDPLDAMLTSNHLALARLAYHTQQGAAEGLLPVLASDKVFFGGMHLSLSAEKQYLCSRDLPPPAYISKASGLTLPLKNAQVLEFDYLVGLLQCAARDWAAAHVAFARVVSCPTRDGGVSKIMVEAHKKWILTGLLAHGRVRNTSANNSNSHPNSNNNNNTNLVPALTNVYASKVCCTINKAYVDAAYSFAALDAAALQKHLALALGGGGGGPGNPSGGVGGGASSGSASSGTGSAGAGASAGASADASTSASANPSANVGEDHNVGLATAVTDALVQWKVARLRNIYSKVPLSTVQKTIDDDARTATETTETTVTTTTPTDEVESLVQQLIADGKLKAAIRRPDNGNEPYLEFLPETEELSEAVFAQGLAEAAARLRALAPLYHATNEHLGLDRDYLKAVLREQKRDKEMKEYDASTAGGGVGGGPSGAGPDLFGLETGEFGNGGGVWDEEDYEGLDEDLMVDMA